MINPTFVFWVMWLILLFGGGWVWSPWDPVGRRPFGIIVWIWIMMGLLGIMAKGSPFSGW